jgi:hypothetical protein
MSYAAFGPACKPPRAKLPERTVCLRPRSELEARDTICPPYAKQCHLFGKEIIVDKVVFLSGTTRGATLEGIAQSLASGFNSFGIEFVEISLLDVGRFLESIQAIDFRKVKLIFSWVSMGMDVILNEDDGSTRNLWKSLNLPFITLHGDSPAYFFDRHVARDSSVVSLYGFTEHCQLRKRLPNVRGPIDTLWPFPLDEVPRQDIDFKTKKNGKLLFLKNGKDPIQIRLLWTSFLQPRLLRAILEIAQELETNLDDPANNQIDDLVTRYFSDHGFDTESLVNLRLFFIAQLDDYLRAVKCTRVAEALMDFPVEIRGNDWNHLDFTGKKATHIDECDYVKSIGLVRNSLGIIDMSPNTGSRPHDRPMRAYGAHTLCLSNEQQFLEELPHTQRLSFRYEKQVLQDRVAYLLDHKDEALEMGIEVAAAYRTQHPPEQLIQQMLDWAALVNLNNHPQRPAAMQDFFVWPPTRL